MMTEQIKPTQEQIILELEENPVYTPSLLSAVLEKWLNASGVEIQDIENKTKRGQILANFWSSVQNVGIKVGASVKSETYGTYMERHDQSWT